MNRRRRTGASAAEQARAALALLELPESESLRVAEELDLPEPQPGPQTVASESDAQIIFYGGHAGGGKTWWLQREGFRHHRNPLYRSLLLRRTVKQALKPGALCDGATEMYRPYGARSTQRGLSHEFPSGATATISGCEHDKNRFDFDGSQLGFIGFDQVEQFEETMFWYIALSRSRSMAGIPTRVGATANPVNPKDRVGGWLSLMLMQGGWIDASTGYAKPEMSGVVRWFYRDRGELHFFASKREARRAFPDKASRGVDPKSMTFVEARLEDNVFLEQADPDYRNNLEALPWIERQRLLAGNWKVSTAGGGIIKREWIRRLARDPSSVSEGQPPDPAYWSAQVRAWDLAATAANEAHAKDRTAGVKMGRAVASGRFVIRDAIARQLSPRGVRELVSDTMLDDGPEVAIRLPQDPGQAGKDQIRSLIAHLRRVSAENGRRPPKIVAVRPTGSKLSRGMGFARDCEPARMDADGEVEIYGSVDVVAGDQVDELLDELHHYDGSDGSADDFWDASADAHAQLIEETSKRKARVY